MEKRLPTLEEAVQKYSTEQQQRATEAEKKEQKIAVEKAVLEKEYVILTGKSVVGALIAKFPLIEKIFPPESVALYGLCSEYFDDVYSDDGEPINAKPRLVLAIALHEYDYISTRNTHTNSLRSIKQLEFSLDEKQVRITHRFRVRFHQHAGRWGNPVGIRWEEENWTPDGIPISQFKTEVDPYIAKFCEQYKNAAITPDDQWDLNPMQIVRGSRYNLVKKLYPRKD